ncbi:Sec-independent protein translocase protein TatB [Spongorhabdus nitratireducens]
MFDIGFTELVVIALVALVVLGPERLPHAIKVTAMWIGKIKRSFNSVKEEIEREIRVDEIRRDLHNESVMEELRKTREKAENLQGSFTETMNQSIGGENIMTPPDQKSEDRRADKEASDTSSVTSKK